MGGYRWRWQSCVQYWWILSAVPLHVRVWLADSSVLSPGDSQ